MKLKFEALILILCITVLPAYAHTVLPRKVVSNARSFFAGYQTKGPVDERALQVTHVAQLHAIRSYPNLRVGFGNYQRSPNYSGTEVNYPLLVTQGTLEVPVNNSSSSGVFQISSSSQTAQALAAMGWKKTSASNARMSAIFGEAVDVVGGTSTFVEGGRFQGTLINGARNGSAYGVICAAGAQAGASQPKYVIGCEGESDNQRGPDAPNFMSFNKDAYTASFVATNGCVSCGSFRADAAFVTNPYSEKPFQTGLLIGEKSVIGSGIAFRPGTSMETGIDMSQAKLTRAALIIPNNVQLMARDRTNTRNLGILAVDKSNDLVIGKGIEKATFAAPVYVAHGIKLAKTTVGSLPSCNASQEGTIEAVTDASSSTFNVPLSGGGNNHVMAYCNGTGWTVH